MNDYTSRLQDVTTVELAIKQFYLLVNWKLLEYCCNCNIIIIEYYWIIKWLQFKWILELLLHRIYIYVVSFYGILFFLITIYSLTRSRVKLSHSTALPSNIHAYDTRHTRDLPSWHAIDAGNIVPCEPVRRWRRANRRSMQRRSATTLDSLINSLINTPFRLILATQAQETSTRNLCKSPYPYKKLARVSVNLVQGYCMQLSTALFEHRNCPARDTNCATWLDGELFWCKKLWWTCVKFFMQVSGTRFLSLCRRHNTFHQSANIRLVNKLVNQRSTQTNSQQSNPMQYSFNRLTAIIRCH